MRGRSASRFIGSYEWTHGESIEDAFNYLPRREMKIWDDEVLKGFGMVGPFDEARGKHPSRGGLY